jgi:hypothetical protein
MRAHPGDRIIMAAVAVDGPVRDGEVLEARGASDGPPYLVRWSDGHVSLLYPGPGSVLQVAPEKPAEATEPEPAEPAEGERRVRTWQVQVSVVESGDDTDAEVVLLADLPEQLAAHGHSHRSPRDPAAPVVGDEVAVARALRHLADVLLDTAARDIEQSTGEHDVEISPS